MRSPLAFRQGDDGTVDVLHVLFGGLSGHATVVRELALQLRERGLRSGACLYAPPGSFLDDPLSWMGVDTVVAVEKRGRLDPAGARAIGRAITHHRPGAVIWHAHYASRELRRLKATGHDFPLIMVEHQALHLRSWGDHARSLMSLPAASAVVFLSEEYRNGYLFRAPPFAALSRSVVIPNGIDVERFSPGSRGSAADGIVNVGMMGRMDGSKDFMSCIRAATHWAAAARPSPVRLLLAGDGRERRLLEQRVQALGLSGSVDFVGALDPPAVISFLRSLDIYIHMSPGETHSTAIMEAYATGLPLIAGDVWGVRNQVRDGVDGLLVPSQDVAGLASKVLELAADSEERKRLAVAARERAVKEFSSDLMADRYLRLLHSMKPDGPWLDALHATGPGATHE